MPSLDSMWAFSALAFVLIVVPGPSVLFVIGRAVALGRRAALLTVLGNAAGVFVQVLLVAIGLGAVVARSATAFTVLKLFGAAYLVWLGIRAMRDRHHMATALHPDQTNGSRRAVLLDGFVVGAMNPKSIVFFSAVLPQFIAPSGGAPAIQMALLGLVFVTIALVSDGCWALAAGTARVWLARSPRRLERLSVGGGTAMIGVGVHLAVTGRSD